GQERVPIAHPDVDRERPAALGEPALDRPRLALGELVVGGAAADFLVMMLDLAQALVRNAAAGGDVAEEGKDLLGSRGPAESDEEHGVDGSPRAARGHVRCHRTLSSWTKSTSARTCSTAVSGSTPWPRLKTCPARPRAWSRM